VGDINGITAKSVTNFGTEPVELPLISPSPASPLMGGKLPADTTAWII
jgi:hypothetical protein